MMNKKMNKKLAYLNIFIILLLAAMYIGGYYLLNYPMRFSFWHLIEKCQPIYLCVMLAVTALIAYLISSIPLKKQSFKNKFIRVFPVLNTMILIFFMYSSTSTFIATKKEISKAENQYILQAEKDIKNDAVTFKYAGGFSIPKYDEKTIHSIDSIRKKYGIVYENTGCFINYIDIEAKKKYEETVKPYLEKRNGANWEVKMGKEISRLKKTDHSQSH